MKFGWGRKDKQEKEEQEVLEQENGQQEDVAEQDEAEPVEEEQVETEQEAVGQEMEISEQTDMEPEAENETGETEQSETLEDSGVSEEAQEESTGESSEDVPEEAAEEPGEDVPEGSAEEPGEDVPEGSAEKKQGFFSRLVAGLTKTRDSFISGIDSIFSGFSAIDDDFYEEIEEILIMGDIGVRATEEILDNLREKVKENHIKQPQECKDLLIQSIKEQMEVGETAYRFEEEKSVVLIVGVNGVGKTTSVGKLAGKLKAQGRKVVLAAADTFRAAAGAQLEEWAHRAGVDMIGGQEGADPAAVVYDAVAAAKARKADVLLCDTAGRLHNKKNLMEELKKINRILEKEYPDAFRETLVVLDGTTGQNALAQAKQFMEVAQITGIILTKMDGTAKGGIAVAIQSELGIPVKYIGVGETIDDLQKFDSEQFVDALFATREE